jgi:exo-1,4-beta-D-glucosaminidase
MLNAAWPKLYWQLYDYFLMPTGAFYGARKGGQPLSLVLDYGDQSVWLVNQTEAAARGLRAVVRVYDLDSMKVMEQTLPVAVAEPGSAKLMDLPRTTPATPVQFLALRLERPEGELVSDNFYWLSSKPDVLDLEKTTWFVTPNKDFADFTALARLPRATLDADLLQETHGPDEELSVMLKNTGSTIAFFLELSIVGDRSGRTVLPVLWDDNYVSLLPGERKMLRARFATADLGGERPAFRLSGWNVDPKRD